MSEIKSLISELKFEMFKNILLDTFLRAVLAFFIFELISSIIDLSYIFSYIFASGYFLFIIRKRMKKIHLKSFEKRNPEIRDMLMTAADNMNSNSIVAKDLFKEVITKARKLSSGTLIMPKTILIMVLMLPVLAVANFESTPLMIQGFSQDDIYEKANDIGFINKLINNSGEKENIPDDEALLEEDIYGDKSMADLGNNEIDVKMNLGFETDLTKPKEIDEEQVTFTNYPDNQDAELEDDDKEFSDDLAEDAKLSIEYNKKIRNIK